jgi:quinol monooxygenase YgiN
VSFQLTTVSHLRVGCVACFLVPDAVYLALFIPRPGRTGDVARVLGCLFEPSRAEPANCGFELYRAASEPPRFVLLERYDSTEGYLEHWRQPHMVGLLDQAEELLACPPEILPLTDAIEGSP